VPRSTKTIELLKKLRLVDKLDLMHLQGEKHYEVKTPKGPRPPGDPDWKSGGRCRSCRNRVRIADTEEAPLAAVNL